MNVSDAERVAGILNTHGFQATSDEKEADIIVAFACSVREKAVHKIMGKGNQWRKLNWNDSRKAVNKETRSRVSLQIQAKKPITILTGCILEQDKKKLKEKFDLVFDIKNTKLLSCYLTNLLERNKKQGNKATSYQCDLKNFDDYLSINPQYQSNYSVYVPIMTGCDNFCSYCAVPYTRGREVSRAEKDILDEVRELIKKGYKEITLLGQNVNSYGVNNKFQITNNKQISNSKLQKDKNHNTYYLLHTTKSNSEFVNLLNKIDLLEGDHWLRFYANHPKDFNDELIDFLAKSKHFCRYIHLPLQSGDNTILKKMNRHYTAEQYFEIIKKIKKEIPDCAITTDIIVGFPGETEKQFKNTVKLLEKVSFDMIFISEYSPRSGTVAAEMEDDVSHEEKGRRKKYLNDEVLAKSVLANNKKLVGKKVRVLIYKKVHPANLAGDKNGFFVGKTEGLKDVRIFVEARFIAPEIGEFANIKITKANSWGLEGEIIF